jgi:hypothetical protein
MPFRCPSCTAPCANLEQHKRRNPLCDRAPREQAPPPRAPPSTAGVEADDHFKNKFARRINLDYASLRYKRFIETSHCSAFHTCAIGWMDMLFEAALDVAMDASSVSEAVRAMRELHADGRKVLTDYHSQAARDAYLLKVVKIPYIKPMPFNPSSPEEFRKFAAKLSISQLLERIMQHDEKARKLIIAKSDEWMIGDKHNVRATVYADITDGWRCRSASPAAPPPAASPPAAATPAAATPAAATPAAATPAPAAPAPAAPDPAPPSAALPTAAPPTDAPPAAAAPPAGATRTSCARPTPPRSWRRIRAHRHGQRPLS